jgi:hypothetical protein
MPKRTGCVGNAHTITAVPSGVTWGWLRAKTCDAISVPVGERRGIRALLPSATENLKSCGICFELLLCNSNGRKPLQLFHLRGRGAACLLPVVFFVSISRTLRAILRRVKRKAFFVLSFCNVDKEGFAGGPRQATECVTEVDGAMYGT